MIRKVIVLATACLILKGAREDGSLRCRGRNTGTAGLGVPTRLGLNGGLRCRRSLGKYSGASTAAAPSTMPGTKATSSKAAPAAIVSPQIMYRFITCPNVERSRLALQHAKCNIAAKHDSYNGHEEDAPAFRAGAGRRGQSSIF